MHRLNECDCWDFYVERMFLGQKHKMYLCFPRRILREDITRTHVATAINKNPLYRVLRMPQRRKRRGSILWARMPYGDVRYFVAPEIMGVTFMTTATASWVSDPQDIDGGAPLWEVYTAELERRSKEELRKQLMANPEKRCGA